MGRPRTKRLTDEEWEMFLDAVVMLEVSWQDEDDTDDRMACLDQIIQKVRKGLYE